MKLQEKWKTDTMIAEYENNVLFASFFLYEKWKQYLPTSLNTLTS